MNSVRQHVVFAVVGLCFVAARVGATPLTLTETTDFSNTSPGSVVGTLDVGVNTVAGDVNGATDLADYFELAVPASMIVTDLRLDVTNYTAGASTGTGVFELTFGDMGWTGLSSNNSHAVNSNNFFEIHSTDLLTGPGTFGVFFVSPTMTLISGTGTVTTPPGFDYTVTATVESAASAIPEPATLTLTTLGLLGAVRRSHRRSR